MTDILVADNLIQLMKDEKDSVNTKNRKLEQIKFFFSIKYKENKEYDRLIKEYIVSDKKVRNGEAVIKGTRITVEDIVYIVRDENWKKDIYKQYPSIQNEKQILAALLYVVKYKIGSIKFLLAILFG